MHWSAAKKVVVGFGLAVALLVVVAVVSYQTTRQFIETGRWVTHTHQVLAELEAVLSTMKDAETGQRRYLISGEERYLEPYHAAARNVRQAIQELRTLTADNFNQQRRLDSTETLVVSKLAELDKTIALRRGQRLDAALEVVQTDEGKQLMDEIRRVIAEMKDEEYALLERRVADSAASAQMMLTIFILALVGLAFLSLAVYFVHRDLAKRKSAEQSAQDIRAFAESIVETVREPLVVLDTDLRVRMANRSFYQTFQMSREDTENRLIYELGNGQWNIPALRTPLEYAVLPQHRSFQDVEVDQEFPAIGRRTMLFSARTLYRPGNNTEMILLAIEDITERKQAEAALASYTAKLERSNQDLQDFASIASHDLQEPLRKILAFGDRLKTHYGEVLDAQGQDYLTRMRNAAERMSLLLESLLHYARVATKARPFEPTNLETVVSEVLGDLGERLRACGGKVEVGPLPTVAADKLQMRQLFQNLLANALKFHKDGETPLVIVNSRRVGTTHWKILVVDNGIGFEEQYLDRIFRPFQRLHGRGDYEGSGMGLAICRKIVMRHDGTITARSKPGKGSAFIITLPAKEKASWSDKPNPSSL